MLFKDIPGHNQLKERLIRNVRDNRISHTQMFLGEEGSAKLSLALAFAQYINCTNRTDTDSCGVCPSCLKFEKLTHPDLHFVFPVTTNNKVKSKPLSRDFLTEWREMLLRMNGNIGIENWMDEIGAGNKQGLISAEECNEIIKVLHLKAYESDYKVMIIYRVEQLFYAAAPKLLKILEEPPANTLFILLSEDRDKILSTILSRTQIIQIPQYSPDEVEAYLKDRKNVESEKARLIASLSNGNLHQALLNAQAASIENIYFDLFRDWMRLCYIGKFAQIFPFNNDLNKRGREQVKRFLNFGMRTARHCMLCNYAQDAMLHLSDEEAAFVQKFSPFFNPYNLIQIIEELEQAIYHLERNVHINMLLGDLSVKFIKLLKIKG